jgi:uncharacterized cupin superfamily protein
MAASQAEALRMQLIRNFDRVDKQLERRDPLYETLCARLAVGTAANKLGASIDILPPGKRGCPYHYHHAQEELFVVLEGQGTLRVAGEMLAIAAGDVVFIPPGPQYPHQIINTSGAPMKYLSISTRETPEICVYPDSGKYSAWSGGAGAEGSFDSIQRLGPGLDYWEGEP